MSAEKTRIIEQQQRTIKSQYEQIRKQQAALHQIRRAIDRGHVTHAGVLVDEVIKGY